MNHPSMKLPYQTIFPDIRSIHWKKLLDAGLINKDYTVVSWSYLNPFLRDGMLTDREAKQLILIEVTWSDAPRKDLVARLVNYLVRQDKEEILKQIQEQRP